MILIRLLRSDTECDLDLFLDSMVANRNRQQNNMWTATQSQMDAHGKISNHHLTSSFPPWPHSDLNFDVFFNIFWFKLITCLVFHSVMSRIIRERRWTNLCWKYVVGLVQWSLIEIIKCFFYKFYYKFFLKFITCRRRDHLKLTLFFVGSSRMKLVYVHFYMSHLLWSFFVNPFRQL